MKNPIAHNDVDLNVHFESAEKICAEDNNLDNKTLSLFNLSSHTRAKNAIDFALKMRNKNYNVFVVGEERSGRMSATVNYLNEHVKNLPAPFDWIYVKNFVAPHRPIPFNLPAGKGKIFEEHTKDLIKNICMILNKLFNSAGFRKHIDQTSKNLQLQLDQQISKLQVTAAAKGFEIVNNVDGLSVELKADNPENMQPHKKNLDNLQRALNKLSIAATLGNQKIDKQVEKLKQLTAKEAIAPLFKEYKLEFGTYLKDWIDEFKKDVLKNINIFYYEDGDVNKALLEANIKYAINLFVNNNHHAHPQVVIEPNPTYENLFGQIKYKSNEVNGGLETDLTMIRSGALHRANHGILVLRIESLIKDEELWGALKTAIRDKKIIIHERFREGSLPLDDAPSPKSIPLDVQIFLISSPYDYYSFLQIDHDFQNYFKIRAEIDSDLPATLNNITIYQKLIKQTCKIETGRNITPCGISTLTSCSARWTSNREKLSAKFELITDLLIEADANSSNIEKNTPISAQLIEENLEKKRERDSRYEDLLFEEIQRDSIIIESSGKKVGLVNGLTVLNLNDRSFGVPVRISARTYAGSDGVINIEKLTEMAGPIQQKGAFILEGFLKGVFAQKFPLSCECSLTFEQNYTDVEGDSASMAELVAIISSLANLPVTQDIAITGSINQFGESQAVGGIHEKIEGFYRLCKERGFSGKQGVIIPTSNAVNLTLRKEVAEDIKKGNFNIWLADNVYQAVELLLNKPAGVKIDEFGKVKNIFEKDSVFEKAFENLKKFSKIMKKH